MRKFLLLFVILFIIYKSLPILVNQMNDTTSGSFVENITLGLNGIEKTDYSSAIDSFFEGIHHFLVFLNETIEKNPNEKSADPQNYEKPELTTPVQEVFSIYNFELGDTKQEVEKTMGIEKRSSTNEYGLKWYTYHDDYRNFTMVSYDKNNKIVGMYTNQDLISSTKGIEYGSHKEVVREKLGKPLTKFEKDKVFLEFERDEDFDVYFLKDSYVTIFYDKHKGNTVTSLQIISKETEQNKKEFYTEGSSHLLEGFEYQLFDLTNATRVNHGLTILTWNDHVKNTARKHSSDMAENDYFNHQNLDGESPFDRMQEDNVIFTFAGENLAYGQFSSIFAHEGLMNSMGHRENILRKEFEFLGVGVAFNSDSEPYYTENFYAN